MMTAWGTTFLITLVVTGTVVSLIALLIAAILKNRSAATRHLMITGAMTGLLILPLVILSGMTLDLEILPPIQDVAPLESDSTVVEEAAWPGVTESAVPAREISEPSVSAPAAERQTPPLLLALYLAGLLATLTPIVIGISKLRSSLRSAKSSDQLPSGLPTGARVVISPDARTPFVWGWLRPVLVLPEHSTKWESETFRDVLLHELAHVERFDGLSQLLGRLALAVHWFNPFVWVLMRTLLLDAERACDDRVLQAGTDPAEYAERLLSIASGTGKRRFVDEVAAVAMARPSQIATRIETLLDERIRRWKLPLSRVAITVLLAIVAVSATAMVRLAHAPAADAILPVTGDSRSSLPSRDTLPNWADIDDDSLRLRAGVTVLVEGRGQIVMAENRRTILFADPLEVKLGSDPGGPITLYSKDGRHLWKMSPVDRIPANLPGTRIVDTDPDVSSVVDSRNGIRFYLTIDEEGHGVYFEPSRQNPAGSRDSSDESEWESDSDEDYEDHRESGTENSWDSRYTADHPRTISADNSPLYAAVRNGDEDLVRYLLERGMSPNEIWPGDGNPLIVAVHHEHHDVVRALLRAGADPDAGVGGDGNALIEAAGHGNLGLLRLLVEAGGDVNVGVGGDGNPLIAAASNGYIAVLDYLLDHGADIEAVVPGDENALIAAVQDGQFEAVRYLVERGANVNARVEARDWRTGGTEIRTPLNQAVRRGHSEIEWYLRSVGARE